MSASKLSADLRAPAAPLAARVVQGRRRRDHDPDRPVDHLHDLHRGLRTEQGAGIWGAPGGTGATTAWLTGGPLVDGPGRRWIFVINVPVGLAAHATSPVLLRESRAALTRRS